MELEQRLLSLIWQDRTDDAFDLLLEHPRADLSHPGGHSLILEALDRGHAVFAAILADQTPALQTGEAAAIGDVERLGQLLADEPARRNDPDRRGRSPLYLASRHGRPEAARLLLDWGADPHQESTDARHDTPLHAACRGRHPELTAQLLEAGVEPVGRDGHGYTPVHEAAASGDADSLHLLLAAGAEAEPPSRDGESPLQLAQRAGHRDAAEVLRQAAKPVPAILVAPLLAH
ncbi:MAG: ankyrin repeat domain-containing protein [Thermoplasmatota archaeon]